jgi:hypothetical protein
MRIHSDLLLTALIGDSYLLDRQVPTGKRELEDAEYLEGQCCKASMIHVKIIHYTLGSD